VEYSESANKNKTKNDSPSAAKEAEKMMLRRTIARETVEK